MKANGVTMRATWLVAMMLTLTTMRAQSAQETERLRIETTQNLTDNILPFWMNKTVDPDGGFYGIVLNDGTPIRQADKGSVLNARILWTFSKAYRHYGLDAYRQIADRAADYYCNHFIDRKFGGVFWTVDCDGNMKDATKQTYACAFGIYGLAEHFRSTGCKRSLQTAISLYKTLESKVHDKAKLGYIESFGRDYTKSNMRGVDGQADAAKTMNTHIHVLEAYTTLYQVWKNKELEANLRELLHLLTTKLYAPERKHLNVFCDEDWNPIGEVDSYGHDIETAWLMCETANALGDSQLKAQVEAQAIAMTETTLKEGLDSNGAMRYEKEHGKFSPRMSWWPQCETIIGAVNAWQLTGNKKYFEAAQHTWDYVKAHFIDSKNGGWYKGLNTDGTPNREPKVSDWNCPYHNSRMAYELAERLNKGCQM